MTNPILHMQQNTGEMYSEVDSLNKEVSVDSFNRWAVKEQWHSVWLSAYLPDHTTKSSPVWSDRGDMNVQFFMDRVPLMNFWNHQSTQPAMTRDLCTDCQVSDASRFSVLLYFTCTPQRSLNTFVLNTRTELKGFIIFMYM